MANSKRRLGRGLESLISGSVSNAPTKNNSKPSNPASKKKVASKAPSRAPAPSKTPATKSKPIPVAAVVPAPVAAVVPMPVAPEARGPGLREISIAKVVPNPHQPRKNFDDTSLGELAESIRSEGLLQPIVVREVESGYELIAGERRWRACQQLKMKRIPARIMEASESSSAVMSLIENLQRENLNPVDEAQGYSSLMKDFDLTQEAVSERVGKARATIANSLRLLQLDQEILQYLAKRMLSVGHAKVLLGIEAKDEQALLARQVIERQLSVRETERLVQNQRSGVSVKAGHTKGKLLSSAEQAALQDLEKRLTQSLNTRVKLKHTPKKGRILIEYFGNDDLHRILDRMGISE